MDLFYTWIKQNPRIKSSLGTTEIAVKTQMCIAVSVYVLIPIIRKRRLLKVSLHTILLFLTVTIFEKIPSNQSLTESHHTMEQIEPPNHLNLFG